MNPLSDESNADDDWDASEDSDDGYVPCPHCGETMLEAADYCPACDRWMSSEEPSKQRHPKWVIVVILIVIAAMIYTLIR